jgi:hypothetical protein
VRPRFYVVATSGYSLHKRTPATSYAVLDRAYCHREVFTAYAGQDRAGGRTDAQRREWCERAAAERNQRHEQRMADLLTS